MATPLIAVAPMMACTDRHDRYFLRIIAPDVWLYTEMRTVQSLIHGDAKRLLAFHKSEKPLALQLGGSDPCLLAQGAKMGEDFGYDEVNLNVGCPSPRVSSARFGACLMLEPQLVADSVAAMQAAVKIPVTVKCRIGVNDHDSYEDLYQFIKLVAQAGCGLFIIHARTALLAGLSPKENREIPPLRYDRVQKIKNDFPHLTIILNGGMQTCEHVETQLQQLGVDGVMIGRAAYANPYLLAELQAKYFPTTPIRSRHEVIERFIPYVHSELIENKVRLNNITRHILGLFKGQPGAQAWRRYLSEEACKKLADVNVIERALALMPRF